MIETGAAASAPGAEESAAQRAPAAAAPPAAPARTSLAGTALPPRRRCSRAAGASPPRPPSAAARTRPASTCSRSQAPVPTDASCRRTSRRTSHAAVQRRRPCVPRPARCRAAARRRPPRRSRSSGCAAYRQRMSEAKRNIPHFAYVEEVDVTELESLRRHLNRKPAAGAGSLTYLPFLALGLVRVLARLPAVQCPLRCRAWRHRAVRAVHLGIATQTPDGLKVPVVHDAQNLGLWELAGEIRRVSEARAQQQGARARSSVVRPSPSRASASSAASPARRSSIPPRWRSSARTAPSSARW